MDFAGGLGGQLLHVAHSFDAEDVGNFVGVGDRADRAVGHGNAGEFRRGEHGTFDVHVGIDEARAEIAGISDRLVFADSDNFAVGDFDYSGENALVGDIDDLAAEVHGREVFSFGLGPSRGLGPVFSRGRV